MRIAVNGRILVQDQREGIGWFAKSLIETTAAAYPDTDWTILHPAHQQMDSFPLPNIKTKGISSPFITARKGLSWLAGCGFELPAWVHHSLPRGLRQVRPDVFFSPDGIAPPHKKYPAVLTIHDLAPLRVPSFMRWRDRVYYSAYLPRIARRSDALITVSEFSKNEISKLLRVPAEKVHVVHNVVREGFQPINSEQKEEVRKKYSGGKPYLLYVGAIHPRKNLVKLLEAYHHFRQRTEPSVKLILAGAKGWSWHTLFDKIDQSPYREDIHWLGYLPEAELYRLTAAASAAVNLSLYEGFGMPIVEAMACETPVLCADRSAFPEISGGAALLVDPDNVEEVSNGLHDIIHDTARRQILMKRGLERSLSFHWRGAADEFYKCLLLASNPK